MPLNKCSILVVEDEALIAANLVHTLISLGYTVQDPVATGEDAISAVKTQKPDLVLMDIQLLGAMNGIEATEKIRAIADIPVVYLTAHTDDLRLKQAKLTEPYGYIVKPAHSRELHATIEMAIYKHGLDRKLKESEEKYRTLITSLNEGVWVIDKDAVTTFVNPKMAMILGYTVEEMTGRSLFSFMDEEGRRICEKNIERRQQGIKEQHDFEFLKKDGVRIYASLEATPITGKDGEYLGAIAGVSDITKRKLAEDALRESEGKLNAILQSVADTMSIMDADLNIIWANDTAKQYFGNDITGRKCYEAFHRRPNPCEPYPCLTLKAFQDGKVHRHETAVVDTQGQIHFFECSANVAMKDENGKPVAVQEISRDITERKKAEENLVASLQRTQDQQAALNTISFSPLLFSGDVHGLSARLTELSSGVLGVDRASVWLFNSKGDELRCIDLYEVLYDRHSYDFILKRREYMNEFEALSTAKFIDAHDPLTDPRTAGYVNSYLKPNRITSMLDAVIRVSGQNLGVLCFEHVDRSHHWENDEIAFACQLADQIAITLLNHDRKLAEESLQESERRLKDIIDFSPDATLVIDKNGIVLAWNRAMEVMTSVPADQMIGKANYEYALPFYHERRPITIDLILHEDLAIDAKYPFMQKEGRSRRSEIFIPHFNKGSGAYLSFKASPLYDTAGNITGAIESIRDITERKRMEDVLKQSKERYRNVVEDQTEFICRFLPDGTHIFVNDAYCRYFGKKRGEIIGHRFRPVLHPEDREPVVRHLASLTTEHPVLEIDQRVIMPDGSTRWQRWSDRAIFDPNGRVIEYQSVGRDITEQKELEKEMKYHEQELRKYSTSLAAANKKLNLLSSITRHDINNQLTVLMGYLTIMEKKQTDPTFNNYFGKVSTAAQRILSMIRFTKEYESIGVNAPVWQYCGTLADTAAKQAPLGKVAVKNDLPAGMEVFADPLVEKVFYNLMDNAVRYGGKITTIRFSAEEAGDDHLIVCEDDGDGIVAEEKEKIFERGFGKNTGLGLALSREILLITGITIRETGEPGKGARFEMIVPKGAWRMTGKGE